MSDMKLVKSITDAAVITSLAASIGWIGEKNSQRKLHSRPQCEHYELRQVHSCHGWQHRTEEIPCGRENPSRQHVNTHCIYTSEQWPQSL